MDKTTALRIVWRVQNLYKAGYEDETIAVVLMQEFPLDNAPVQESKGGRGKEKCDEDPVL